VVTDPTEAWRHGRVAIVTGGSRGTGREAARALACSGYAVVIDYAHDQPTADATVDEILATGGTAIALRADVSDELDVERLFTETVAAFGGVDFVLHATTAHDYSLVRPEAARHLSAGGAIVSFAGRWQPGLTTDVPELMRWLTSAHRNTSAGEVVVLPVSDVDESKRFYQDLGWSLDADVRKRDDFRVVQLTPPGSPASIIFGAGVTPAAPGSAADLTLSVYDRDTNRAHVILRDPDGNTWLLHEIGEERRYETT
jgi:hypothetical protein